MTDSDVITNGFVFGEWDAPVTDDHTPLGSTPVDLPCVWCQEPIQDGDNGRIATLFLWGGVPVGGHIEHRECSLRNAMGGIGHLVDHGRYCHDIGPDAGLSRRHSSLMTWDFFQETRLQPTAKEQEIWRRRVDEAHKEE